LIHIVLKDFLYFIEGKAKLLAMVWPVCMERWLILQAALEAKIMHRQCFVRINTLILGQHSSVLLDPQEWTGPTERFI